MDFLKQFQDKIKRINHGGEIKIKPRVSQLSSVKLYSLVTLYNDKRKLVGCGLTRYEAALLIPHVEKRLRRIMEPDGTGKTLFEVTQILIEEEK